MESGGPYMVESKRSKHNLHYNRLTTWQGDASAEHLLAELGQLSLNTLTQKWKTKGVNQPSRRRQ